MDRVMRYIKATTTLYGAVPKDKVAVIYNDQNEDAITVEEIERYSDQALETESVWAQGDYFAH